MKLVLASIVLGNISSFLFVSSFITPLPTTFTEISTLLPSVRVATGRGFSNNRGVKEATRLFLIKKSEVKSQKQKSSFFPFEDSIGRRSDKILLGVAPGTDEKRTNGPNAEAEDGSGSVRQLLGLKGASASSDIWKIRLQLTKPVTWIPLIWGVMCGAAASGNYHWMWNPFNENDRDVLLGLEDTAKAIVAMFLAGPLLTGYTQTINDWYDRDIDAINEPYRPIPSGAISEKQVIEQIWFLLLSALGIAYGLDVWCDHEVPTILLLSIFGSFISYIYSAPPLKLKQNGWAGNYALGCSYISLPWWCGQAVFGQLDRPVYFIL